MKTVTAAMWICAGALYVCAAALVVTGTVASVVFALVLLALGYCVTEHAWTLTKRLRKAALDWLAELDR
jgi:hypothetical protein